eukprot:gene31612-38204_t
MSLSQLAPFLKIAVPFFKEDATARNSLIAVSALTLLNSGISVAFSYVSRDFYNALNERNEGLFYEKIALFLGALAIALPLNVYYRFILERLSLSWREGLTANALELYYSNRTFYQIETLKDVDNPDQRIAEDIRRFTSTSLDFFLTIFTSVIDLLSFSAILFQINAGLFGAVVVYSGIGTFITTRLGQSLVKLNYERIQREANFRFSLFRTRENAESIAFYDSRAVIEQRNVWELFQEALDTQLGIIKVQRKLDFFTTGYRYIIQILPIVIIAPQYFAHKVELGAITQSNSAFNHILSDFSLVINSFESLSAFSAGLTRLSSFFDRINSPNSSANAGAVKPSIRLDTITLSNNAVLECSNLTLFTPDMTRCLLGNIGRHVDLSESEKSSDEMQGVDVSIFRGDRLLIVGPSGAGKSSLVRAIAGLWQVGYGSISWDSSLCSDQDELSQSGDSVPSAPKKVFFLPQKPYNLLGDLRQQIMYPQVIQLNKALDKHTFSNASSIYSSMRLDKRVKADDSSSSSPSVDVVAFEDDSSFLDILQKVRLGDLAAKMGQGDTKRGLRVDKDWSKTLSLGEQQRLAFARVLYNRPDVVVLDEASSALDLASEEQMYELLRTLNITYVSVGHRPSLVKYHNKKLVLGGSGNVPKVVNIVTHDHGKDVGDMYT